MRFPSFFFSTFSPALWTLLWFQFTGFKKYFTPIFLSLTGQPHCNSSAISTQEILHSSELYTVMSSYNCTLSAKPYLLLIPLCYSFYPPFYSPLSSSNSSPTLLLYLSTLLLAPLGRLKELRRRVDIEPEVSIVRDIKGGEVRIYTDYGRIMRYVLTNVRNSLFTTSASSVDFVL